MNVSVCAVKSMFVCICIICCTFLFIYSFSVCILLCLYKYVTYIIMMFIKTSYDYFWILNIWVLLLKLQGTLYTLF